MPGARIIVVDDEESMRITLGDILGDCGFSVSTADTGEAAVRMCERTRFDLVLMDVRLPGIDGIEAFRRIRRRHSDLPVIMMSAYTLEELERVAVAEGAVAFLRKPLDADEVLELIGDTLSEGRADGRRE